MKKHLQSTQIADKPHGSVSTLFNNFIFFFLFLSRLSPQSPLEGLRPKTSNPPHPQPQVSFTLHSFMARGPSRPYFFFPLGGFSCYSVFLFYLGFFFLWLWIKLAGVLIFSAIPFTAVKAIANSPLGESLQRRMEERKKFAVRNASKFKTLSEKARKQR